MKSLIINIRALDQFIASLPELEEDETYFYGFMIRRKYSPGLNVDSFIERSNTKKKHLKNKLGNFIVGDFRTFDDAPIPYEAYACYMKFNPRSTDRALFTSVNMISENLSKVNSENNFKMGKIKHALNSLLENIDERPITRNDIESIQKTMDLKTSKVKSLKTIAKDAIQESVSRRLIIDLDFDIKEGVFSFKELYDVLVECFGENLEGVRSIIKTRGGFHVQLNATDKVKKGQHKDWYQALPKSLPNNVIFEMQKDSFCPIPGTTQGNFEPVLVYYNDGQQVKMTSDSWDSLNTNVVILDPDGWDRKDYTWSFERELITQNEFETKRMWSTVKGLDFKQQ